MEATATQYYGATSAGTGGTAVELVDYDESYDACRDEVAMLEDEPVVVEPEFAEVIGAKNSSLYRLTPDRDLRSGFD